MLEALFVALQHSNWPLCFGKMRVQFNSSVSKKWTAAFYRHTDSARHVRSTRPNAFSDDSFIVAQHVVIRSLDVDNDTLR